MCVSITFLVLESSQEAPSSVAVSAGVIDDETIDDPEATTEG